MGFEIKEAEPMLDLKEYFSRRGSTMKALDEELVQLADMLKDLIPAELEEFKNEAFHNMTEWLQYLNANTSVGGYSSHNFKTVDQTAFTDLDEVEQKMKKLALAWDGIVDVEIVRTEWALEVRYRIADSG